MNWRKGTEKPDKAEVMTYCILKDGRHVPLIWSGEMWGIPSPIDGSIFDVAYWVYPSEIPGPDPSTDSEVYEIYEASGQPAIFPRGGFERWPAGSKVVVSREVAEIGVKLKWKHSGRIEAKIGDYLLIVFPCGGGRFPWTVKHFGGWLPRLPSGEADSLVGAQIEAERAAQALMEGKDRD